VDVCYDDTCQYCIDDDELCEQAGVAYPADCCDSDRTCTRYGFDITYKCRECIARGSFCVTGSTQAPCCGTDICENNICTEDCVAEGDGKQCRNFVCQDPCVAEGATCVEGLTPCCGDHSCQGGTCQDCWPDSAECTANIDCCVPSQTCNISPGSGTGLRCEECIGNGEACTTGIGATPCCGIMSCDGGVCSSSSFG
jgi:hypothetical protein